MSTEHPFAQYIRTLGKGKKGQRSLTQDQARAAMDMIIQEKIEPCQLGAFLMLMRVKEETPEEVAGFVESIRSSIKKPNKLPNVSVDWSSYAGKRRQLPWFVMSAILLGQNGIPVFMHGTMREDERLYAPQALQALGIHLCSSLEEAGGQIEKTGFAYLSIENLSPLVHEMINLRSVLGLRSPLHTIARMLNPFNAGLLMQGIFHPGYAVIHQQAASLLNQKQAAVFKGEGGEIECDPDKDTIVYGLNAGNSFKEQWPAYFSGNKHLKDETMDLHRFRDVWEGKASDEYGEAAVITTAAIALKNMGKVCSQKEALDLAGNWWLNRAKSLAA